VPEVARRRLQRKQSGATVANGVPNQAGQGIVAKCVTAMILILQEMIFFMISAETTKQGRV
jgi:hypothetical protein